MEEMIFEEFGKQYTDDEMIMRAWDKECIHDLMGRFVLYWGNGQRQQAIDQLWVATEEYQKDASFATNIGFYVGIDEVKRHFVTEYHEKQVENLAAFQVADPAAGYGEKDLGLGMTEMHSTTTPVLFIANDGQTARYLGYDLGMSGRGKPDGSGDCYMEFALILAELVRENGQWKIWHLVEEHDFSIETGVDYNDVPTRITDPNDPSRKNFGDPTVKKDVYDDLFGWEYLFYDWPKPYKTYDEDEGYGPKGKVGRKYYERVM